MNEFLRRLEHAAPERGTVAVFWLEQSHFVFKTSSGLVIHVDPFLSRTIKPDNFIHPEPLVAPGQAMGDFVFLTHDHRDHTDPDTIGPMAASFPACRFTGPPESCARCASVGIEPERTEAILEGEEKDYGEFRVRAVFARGTGDKDPTTHLGYVFDLGGVVIYHSGDTRREPEQYLDRLGALRGLKPSVMIVAINEGYNNPGPAGAARLVKWVEPRLAIPCHWDCFKNNTIAPERFVEALEAPWQGRVRIMKRGEMILVRG